MCSNPASKAHRIFVDSTSESVHGFGREAWGVTAGCDMTGVDAVAAENMLRELYQCEAQNGDGSFFVHIGLSLGASWGEFRRHYDSEGVADCDRAAGDVMSFPPIARRLATLKTGRKGPLIWLNDRIQASGPAKSGT